MSTITSKITSFTIVYSTVYSGADQRKHQSSASLAFVRGIHRGPVNSPHKWPVTRKMFPFDDVIMTCETIKHMPSFCDWLSPGWDEIQHWGHWMVPLSVKHISWWAWLFSKWCQIVIAVPSHDCDNTNEANRKKYGYITMTSHGRDVVSLHRSFDCLFER